ncbi:hypothetical protein TGME49_221685 [Toxoplasma gondii ME49]|uniref:Uncharacterized protein n=13 Tax=Toxoplasma gondii TaxID=5811 RepID=A0A125YWB8_TOXGV|nr:hypothetical protein TGME49_221685 [Toxoplasma gondii ME49]EPR58520.1 hypothetical protein TGGT1_221685 [Toxoplasma gondii GT1]ESS30040.1 hypothetical protein TGVEG_221685 [Toxoplasma gondii VEG]KAF4645590.1 hypothetical protein TGRH88_000770 [Toxoplasma gondii]KFG36361.1 hypothetical protein TGP89_221685 [Toxoplasma gondii p89]KFG41513.1 hypothetical protein TGDOM2_221685 [Toxoplasma gondii GAB2-2007-GAL-DOM2]KFG47520.1 hypothetical protein TGFOU_221685 [Toxoplasma gondii FOU]KFG61108.1 |eukprot:XP_018638283.1 hypothetical protein TGME49_221685 [Toxoplasma gondii ME49]
MDAPAFQLLQPFSSLLKRPHVYPVSICVNCFRLDVQESKNFLKVPKRSYSWVSRAEEMAQAIAASARAATGSLAGKKQGKTAAEAFKAPDSISWEALTEFVFPRNLIHPRALGRLYILGFYGNIDEHGKMRAGHFGRHSVTNAEIRVMMTDIYKKALKQMFERTSDGSMHTEDLQARVEKDTFTETTLRKLLESAPQDANGRMKFADIQQLILKDFDKRVRRHVRQIRYGSCVGDNGRSSRRQPRVMYNSKAAEILEQLFNKRKFTATEEFTARERRQNRTMCLVTDSISHEDAQFAAINGMLIRGSGNTDDRWDRCFALRRQGIPSYVDATPSATCHSTKHHVGTG